jgi:hypothetical protein
MLQRQRMSVAVRFLSSIKDALATLPKAAQIAPSQASPSQPAKSAATSNSQPVGIRLYSVMKVFTGLLTASLLPTALAESTL